jgi:AraC-like DNA-binding protein
MSHLVAHSPSLRHGLSLVTQFHGLLIEDVRVALCECMGTARLCCAFDVRVERGVVELIVAGLVRALRAFGCRDDEIDAVCFEHARPAHHPAYRAAFRGAERFGHAFTGVEFAARALDRPHMHWQPELQAFMRAQAERGLSLLSRPRTCAERVRALMSSRRDREAPDMAAASRELGLSVRSLRRRLEEEGTSYRELTQSMLYESACSMLRNPELTLQAIAHALGFADSSTFHRAFLRWSGSTPAAYRAAALHPGVSGLRAPPLRAAAPRGTAQGT